MIENLAVTLYLFHPHWKENTILNNPQPLMYKLTNMKFIYYFGIKLLIGIGLLIMKVHEFDANEILSIVGIKKSFLSILNDVTMLETAKAKFYFVLIK